MSPVLNLWPTENTPTPRACHHSDLPKTPTFHHPHCQRTTRLPSFTGPPPGSAFRNTDLNPGLLEVLPGFLTTASWSGSCLSLPLLELCALAELNLHCSVWPPSHSLLHLGGTPFPTPPSPIQVILQVSVAYHFFQEAFPSWFPVLFLCVPLLRSLSLSIEIAFLFEGLSLAPRGQWLCLPVQTASPELGMVSGTW